MFVYQIFQGSMWHFDFAVIERSQNRQCGQIYTSLTIYYVKWRFAYSRLPARHFHGSFVAAFRPGPGAS